MQFHTAALLEAARQFGLPRIVLVRTTPQARMPVDQRYKLIVEALRQTGAQPVVDVTPNPGVP